MSDSIMLPPDKAQEQFVAAIKSGDVDAARALLASNPYLVENIDAPWFSFDSPAILEASSRKNRDLVELLLEYGADINTRSEWWAGGFGVLPCDDDDWAQYLIRRGAVIDVFAAAGHDKLDLLARLLDADPGLINSRGGDGQTPLHFARSVDTCALLLDRGAQINARDFDHNATPAQYALNQTEKLRYLVSRGSETDIFIAVALGDIARLRAMLSAHPGLLNSTTSSGPHNLIDAPGGHIYIYLLGQNATSLHAAALVNNVEMIHYLIDLGIPVDKTGGYDDSTALHMAAWHNHKEAAEALLDRGAEIDRDSGPKHHNSPAGWALTAGAVETFALLLQRGAPIRPYFKDAAQRGVNGEFAWTGAPRENWTRIQAILDSQTVAS